MGISAAMGTAGLQAGVVADASARPVSPYEGQLIYQLDTNQLLVWDGAAWVAPNSTTANPPGLELITSCTATFTGGTAGSVSNGVITVGSNNTGLVVSNAFSSTYKNYKIVGHGIVGSQALTVRFSLGTSVPASGYYWCRHQRFWNSTSAVSAGNNSGHYECAIATTSGCSFFLDITDPNTDKLKHLSGDYSEMATSGGSSYTNGGFLNSTTTFTDFIISLSAGNISGGTIRVYGYRN